MPSKKRTLTDEGEELPPNPSEDVKAAIHLLEWARAKGFRVGPVLQVGSVKMQISDIRQVRNEKLGGDGGGYDSVPHPEAGLDEPTPGTAG